MKKGYIVFENGVTLEGTVGKEVNNVLGHLEFEEKNIKLKCCVTNELVNFELNENSDLSFEGKVGKLVTDNLPVEYHVYDVKTASI